MDSPCVFFASAEIADRLHCSALSIRGLACVRLRHAERMASQFDTATFRLPGRGVF